MAVSEIDCVFAAALTHRLTKRRPILHRARLARLSESVRHVHFRPFNIIFLRQDLSIGQLKQRELIAALASLPNTLVVFPSNNGRSETKYRDDLILCPTLIFSNPGVFKM